MPPRTRSSSVHITPSAHYTGYVWYRHRLADPAFVTGFGRFVHGLLRPIAWGARAGFDLDIEHLLLQRHLQIDVELTRSIEQGGVTQVVEIACGLSPRGRRFRERYPQLHYIEADLPAMATRKRELLAEQGWLGERHQVLEVDILADGGECSVAALLAGLDRNQPVLVITEGLVNYFPLALIEGFWARLATELARFAGGSYLTDLYPDLHEHPRYRQLRWSVNLIGRLTRGDYPLHYRDHAEIDAGFQRCGYAKVTVLNPGVNAQVLGLRKPKVPGLVRVVHAHA